jgi:hypothetical protein
MSSPGDEANHLTADVMFGSERSAGRRRLIRQVRKSMSEHVEAQAFAN